ncbi:RNA polymerase sigma factor [Herpetosiphon sp. NSE202]|uniref:RNA polymerase sigma factor n=1 Tax=Herpetosiphon sp. NSE202 TaxID=3351349 RepID=UPI00362BF659
MTWNQSNASGVELNKAAKSGASAVDQAQQPADLAQTWATQILAHQTAIFRLAYLMVGDAMIAEDLAQETVMRALRMQHQFDSERPLKPWLLQITANLARNYRRSLRRYLRALQRFALQQPEHSEFHETSGPAWEATQLWHAIGRLAQREQEVLYLRYFLELSEQETAQALGIAQGTVKSRLHRALVRLRGVVDGEFPELRTERCA